MGRTAKKYIFNTNLSFLFLRKSKDSHMSYIGKSCGSIYFLFVLFYLFFYFSKKACESITCMKYKLLQLQKVTRKKWGNLTCI